MRAFFSPSLYVLILVSITVSCLARSDSIGYQATKRALYDLEARDQLDSLLNDLHRRGIASVLSKFKPQGKTEPKPSFGPAIKNAAGAQLQPARPMGIKDLPQSDKDTKSKPTGRLNTPKPSTGKSITSGNDAKLKPQAKPGQENITKPGLAAMKRLEAAQKTGPGGPSPTVTPKTKDNFVTAHEAQMKQDAQKPKGAFGRFKDHAMAINHPSVIPEDKKKPTIKNGVIMDPGKKPEVKFDKSKFEGDGRTANGKVATTWMSKAANAVIHPAHFAQDQRTAAANRHLDYQKQLETQPKIDFQAKQNAFHAAEADRRKDHRLKQQGDMTGVNHAVRHATGANQVLNMVKGAATLRRRSLDDIRYQRVRRFIEALEMENGSEYGE